MLPPHREASDFEQRDESQLRDKHTEETQSTAGKSSFLFFSFSFLQFPHILNERIIPRNIYPAQL